MQQLTTAVVCATRTLGEPYKIRVGHDDSGWGADWHLESVAFLDPVAKVRYLFQVNDWIKVRDLTVDSKFQLLCVRTQTRVPHLLPDVRKAFLLSICYFHGDYLGLLNLVSEYDHDAIDNRVLGGTNVEYFLPALSHRVQPSCSTVRNNEPRHTYRKVRNPFIEQTIICTPFSTKMPNTVKCYV